MTMHMTARIAWHMDGWNGHICKNPAANTYCLGQHSYPGAMIAERRDLKWEAANKGECCSKLETIPPCVYSINAFGTEELTAFTERHWQDFLFDSDSVLATKNPKEYEAAIAGQAVVCQRVFTQHVSVLSGAAGTGKTTVIKAIIQAIERAHGEGTSFQLLAPTGKAADRIRSATGKDAKTIHSFLATNDWLNDNMTSKRSGGRQAAAFPRSSWTSHPCWTTSASLFARQQYLVVSQHSRRDPACKMRESFSQVAAQPEGPFHL